MPLLFSNPFVVSGEEYQDYNLVMASPMGLPTEGSTINGAFHKLIEDNHLPPVVFHSFRHASVTYKLKLTGGDIKSVQGDSGHAQGKMVTDVYSHIIDDERKNTARLFENRSMRRSARRSRRPVRNWSGNCSRIRSLRSC